MAQNYEDGSTQEYSSAPVPDKEKDWAEETDLESGLTRKVLCFKQSPIFFLLMMSASFWFTFFAFSATQNIESTLVPGPLGSWSLAISYVGFAFGSLFVAPTIISKFGPKVGLILGSLPYVGFIAANLYPRWETLPPAAFFTGLGGSVLWSSQGTYLTQVATWHSIQLQQDSRRSIGFFAGTFSAICQSTQIFGNLVTSLVFMYGDVASSSYILFGMFIVSCVVGTSLLFLLKPVEERIHFKVMPEEGMMKRILSTLRMWKDPKMLCFLPLFYYSGLDLGFIAGDFSKELVLKEWIGFVFCFFGLAGSVSSFFLPSVAERFGKTKLVYFALFTHGAFFTLFLVILHFISEQAIQTQYKYLLFAAAAFYGLGDAAVQLFGAMMMSILYSNNTAPAFSNLRLFQSLGFVTAFLWGPILPLYIKLIITASVLVVAGMTLLILNWCTSAIDCPPKIELEVAEEAEPERRLLVP